MASYRVVKNWVVFSRWFFPDVFFPGDFCGVNPWPILHDRYSMFKFLRGKKKCILFLLCKIHVFNKVLTPITRKLSFFVEIRRQWKLLRNSFL